MSTIEELQAEVARLTAENERLRNRWKKPPTDKTLPFFRDIPVGSRFRKVGFRKTLWIKTEPIQPPGANHIMYNAVEAHSTRRTKFGWNAKVILEPTE